jgi:hypothetical protein
VVVVLYGALSSSSPKSRGSSGYDSNNNNGKIVTNASPSNTTTATTQGQQQDQCLRAAPVFQLDHPPTWIAGYPGSGFDLVAPILSSMTGLTVVDVYRHHTCTTVAKTGAAATGACLTHWPILVKDSPEDIATQRGEYYHSRAAFIIRSPAQAIVSYHTRWWGAQRHVLYNHEQPPELDWQDWRDSGKFARHVALWSDTLVAWQHGIPRANVLGIGLYIPYEQLTNNSTGPTVAVQIAQYMEGAKHSVEAKHNAECLWHRYMQPGGLGGHTKQYTAKFRDQDRQLLLDTLDSLTSRYQNIDPHLSTILQSYRTDIATNLPLGPSSSSESATTPLPSFGYSSPLGSSTSTTTVTTPSGASSSPLGSSLSTAMTSPYTGGANTTTSDDETLSESDTSSSTPPLDDSTPLTPNAESNNDPYYGP